jgi:RNA polymerase sigma factor (sigma-70 family)
MAIRQVNAVVQYLNSAGLPEDQPTDKQLLEGFVERRDVTALATLIQRHAPMVWGVCRRLLHKHHDAEDAFQATFLVLVRKAAYIVPAEMVANWLYGVAHQTALKARATTTRRAERERQVTELPEPAATDRELWSDLQPLLDQELVRLPNKYRSVIVLCELEGKSRKEVAAQLGVPEGTVSGRLARARVMLAKRLTKRGIALSAGTLATALAEHGASACVPYTVIASVLDVAKLVVSGQTIASASSAEVATLTEGVLTTMVTSKLKQSAIVILLLIGSLGACGLLYRSSAAEPPQANPGQSDTPRGNGAAPKAEPPAAVEKDNQSALPVGSYTGACQVMTIDENGVVSYPDVPPPGICHMKIKANGVLVAEFPDKELGRGEWHTITLKLSTIEPRPRWNTTHNGDTYQVTAIPFSPEAYIFRLEIFTKGKLVAGAQQFFALPVVPGAGEAKKRRVYQVGDAEVTKMLRDPGSRFDVEVVGKTNGVLSGTDLYFYDSDLDTAAVHAGLVKRGEKAVITVTVVKCPVSEPGSTRNGVKSVRWDAARPGDTAFILQRQGKGRPEVEDPLPANELDEPAVLTPAEAVQRKPNQKVTVECRVAKTELGWNTSEGESRVISLTTDAELKDGGTFHVTLKGSVVTEILGEFDALNLTEPRKTLLNGHVIRVTGTIEPMEKPVKKGTGYVMVVSETGDLKVVK